MVSTSEIDSLIANGGTVFFADPFRDSTRQRQREIMIGSILSLAFTFDVIKPETASNALFEGSNVSNIQAVAFTLSLILFYGLTNYALAVQSDWDVYQHTVMPMRLRALEVLASLRAEIREFSDEVSSLGDHGAADPLKPVGELILESVKRLQNAGFQGTDYNSIISDMERRVEPLLYMINRSARLATARKFIEPYFTFVFVIFSIVVLYLRFLS